MTTPNTFISDPGADLNAQNDYVDKLKKENFNFSLVVAEAFVRGIRDIGYRDTAKAIDELIDNAIQAGASNLHVLFGYGSESEKKPTSIAVYDNGHGMAPDMIRAAMTWGGTHRENSRTGFGRYGYGLPSSCVSQGRRFSVFSRVEGGEFYRVTFDLDELADPSSNALNGGIVIPKAVAEDVPDWVQECLQQETGSRVPSRGTVVIIDKLDRLTWSTTSALKRNLLEQFGITYRNFLPTIDILVDGTKAEPLDPLFITPGMRWYDLDDSFAEAQEPITIEVKDAVTRQPAGVISVRFSYMPPSFQRNAQGSMNARWSIMRAHRGIIVSRNGRQIDVVDAKCPWYTFQTYDNNWGVEIDFPPTLDEEFSITTSKQQVVLSERMWSILEQAGVKAAVGQLRQRYSAERRDERVKREEEAKKRASEAAMERAQRYKTRKPVPSVEQQKRSEAKFRKKVRERVEVTGLPEDQVERELLLEVAERPYRLEYDSMPGAPFYRVEQVGGQRILYLNSAHRFYLDLYAGPDSTPRVRSTLETLLFVIGDGELEADDDRRMFYENERAYWSQQLNTALQLLDEADSIDDELAAQEAMAEDSTEDREEDPAEDPAIVTT